MNAGRNLKTATEWAQANTKSDGKPRYLTMYNGVYWIDRDPPKCSHRRVMPSGEAIDVDGCDSVILS